MIDETTEARARAWAIWLTQQASVTGSDGERALPARLLARLKATPALAGAESWLVAAPGDGRACVALLARGRGAETVLLTGHFDTVGIDDYGDLASVATDPEPLREALLQRLAEPATPAEQLARADLASGDFLPGRGLLDMKAGLAAGLSVVEAFLADPDRRGNLLFVAVPDEEVNSVGARALAAALPAIERERGLVVAAAINLDCIGDIGDGTAGRSIALGSVGKLLLTAHVIGVPAHASHPYQGLNAGALAGAIAMRMEWAPDLADASAGSIPPTLLSLRDGKPHYDVTMPETVFASWNVLTVDRPAADVFARFESLVQAAIADARASLAARRGCPSVHVPDVTVCRSADVLADARRRPGFADEMRRLGDRLTAEGRSLPDQSARLIDLAWRASGRRGAAVVLGVGSLPYPAVRLRARGQPLKVAIDRARACVGARHGISIGVTLVFPGISDMSFIGDAETADVALVSANAPAWETGIRWSGAVGGVPIVNIGPWGRDYHTPLERVHAPYAFRVLPELLTETVRCIVAP